MKRFTIILVLLANISLGQSNEKFLRDILHDTELKTENQLADYNQYNFSNLWTKTENQNILGVIGEEHQRLRIKLISVQRNPVNKNEYFVSGKSKVKETVCDFKGTIILREIKEVNELHYGIDDEYTEKGIRSRGILIAEYELREKKDQKA